MFLSALQVVCLILLRMTLMEVLVIMLFHVAGEILKRVRSVILDEADQLMKSDFQDQVLSLFSHLISRCLQVTFVTWSCCVEDRSVSNYYCESPCPDSPSSPESNGSDCLWYSYWIQKNLSWRTIEFYSPVLYSVVWRKSEEEEVRSIDEEVYSRHWVTASTSSCHSLSDTVRIDS